MAGDIDSQRLSVTCTGCERAVRLTPEQLRTAFGVMCPACGRDLTGRAQTVLREFDRAHPLWRAEDEAVDR